MSGGLLIRDVEVERRRVDVVVEGGFITKIAPTGRRHANAAQEVEGRGGALLPGLHDHHVHLLAAAAARQSLDLATSPLSAADAIREADRQRPREEWLRVVGYHESMLGTLDREVLDALVPHRPLRVQHRSGMMWVLNSAGLDVLGPALPGAPSGVERDASGRPTGRCLRVDDWLRRHLPHVVPDVVAVANQMRSYGVTGVTDMTPFETLEAAAPLLDGRLPLRITVTGSPALTRASIPPTVNVGPVKILVDENDPLEFESLAEIVREAHSHGRSVAVHCVSRSVLALVVAVWNEVGAVTGDRLEHGAVVPPDLAVRLAELRITVVTQPSFTRCRGDDYLRDSAPDDVPHLWPCRSLLDRGVPVAASSDAPFGPADPWAAITAASTRVTAGGRPIGRSEAVTPQRALEMFLGPADDPGGSPRRVEVGAPAELCLLDRPLATALADPAASHVRTTWLPSDCVTSA